MKNILLNDFIEIVLPLIFLLIAIIVSVIIYKKTSRKFKTPQTPSPKQNSTPQVKLKGNYCTEAEMKFLNALHSALPRECISFPHVGISKLIEPKNNMVDFNSVSNKHVDICVFLRKTMTPILVIDLYEPSPASQQLKKFEDCVTKVLKEVKIPILHKQIENAYNISSLRMEVLKAMNNDIIAYLKDTIIPINDNI